MVAKLEQIVHEANRLWPQNLADEWDAPGLVTGNPEQPITNVLLSVDVTASVLNEALDRNCQLIFAHHPFLLRGVTSVAIVAPKGKLLTSAIENSVAIFAAHTNADIVENGVSDIFAKSLGLQSVRALAPTNGNEIGHGRIGKLSRTITLGELALALGRLLPPTASGIRVGGDYDQPIETVALCGGAGDAFISAATAAGADVYITSDLRHHPVQEAREASSTLSLIDVSHWASESLWLPVAAQQLSNAVSDVNFLMSEVRTDAWDFTVTQ